MNNAANMNSGKGMWIAINLGGWRVMNVATNRISEETYEKRNAEALAEMWNGK